MAEPLVVQEHDVEPQKWTDPLRGSLRFHTLTGGENPAPELSAGVAVLESGDGLRRHQHRPAETYYVIEGEGVLTLDGLEHDLRPGTVAYIPGDCEHAVRNDGPERLRVFYVLAAAWFGDIEYRFSEDSQDSEDSGTA